MAVSFVVKKKIRIDGKDYESLADVPPETRAAVERAMASASDPSAKTSVKLLVNGHTYSSTEEVPPALRAIVQGAIAFAEKKEEGAAAALLADAPESFQPVRTEPVVSPRMVAQIALLLLALFLVLRFFH